MKRHRSRYKNKRFDLFLKLKKEVPERAKIPYRLSKVNIYANYSVETDMFSTNITHYENKNFIQKELFFKPKYLSPFVTLKKGQYYNAQTSRNTS